MDTLFNMNLESAILSPDNQKPEKQGSIPCDNHARKYSALEAISSIQTKDQIAAQLRTLIFNGELTDGEEIVQETLAAMLGVSRMPVREALQALETEGLLERLPNRHMRIVRYRQDEIRQMYQVWSAIESEAVQMVIHENHRLDDLITALTAFREAILLGSPVAAVKSEFEFHQLILQALQSRFLARLQKSVLGDHFQYALQQVASQSESHRGERLNCLADLVDALKTHNPHQASSAIQTYYLLFAEPSTEEQKT